MKARAMRQAWRDEEENMGGIVDPVGQIAMRMKLGFAKPL
jgi:hypothetical protein